MRGAISLDGKGKSRIVRAHASLPGCGIGALPRTGTRVKHESIRKRHAPADRPGSAHPAPEDDDGGLALLGHDIRAALSDVIGGLRLIDPERVDPATRLQLERMRAAGELLARLLEEGLAVMLGDVGDTPAGNVQLPRLLHDVQMRWSARAREKGLEFVLSEGGALPPVITADRIGLERTLSNMLSNAVKYTDSGTVRLAVNRVEDGGLSFEVTDDGPGFSDEAMARLFQFAGRPMGAAKPGEGLGLHIAKELAGRAGGDLRALNRPEGGASVTLTLPAEACRPAAVDELEPAPGALPDLSRIRVLVAEDSLTNQTLIARMLERLGAEVEIAGDGIEAVNALERESFDLALIDIEMPRLSGIDVIHALRSMGGRQARIPVLAVTAYVLRANREAIYAAGADAILAKPLGSIEALGVAINRLLERGPDGAEPASTLDRDDTPPVMVRSHFDRLLAVAGPETTPELLRRLLDDLQHVERQLIRALADPDWPELRAQTHVLIALAGAVGAQRLQQQSERLNAVAHRRDSAECAARAGELLALLDNLIHFVAHERTERTIP
jgi:CheY-like chemotaxis protein/HPt (histidine-containing phosphotransfer) domain-containing protein